MEKSPNVLLITTDHWPSSFFGCAGHPAVQTPTLDELSRAGTRFSNAYAECPVCIPARRTLMTGVSPKTHGDRIFNETLPMPDIPTIAQTFRDAGYQAQAVGKLHVYPQRDRIGFDDVILDEEGRVQYGVLDDYELFLGDQGYAGQHFHHGMSNNQYTTRPWHLPEHTHATNWATQSMIRAIKRRDPTRPSFWYLGYRHPHPPLVPLQSYLDLYAGLPIDEPYKGSWAERFDDLPFSLQANVDRGAHMTPFQITAARRAFYALCTHIDHQLRVLIGSLREEDELNNTIICFTTDHGDMLGNHGMWAKKLFYENSANIPMILLGTRGDKRVEVNKVDDRIVGWQDVMPTLLSLAGVPIPETVEGISMVGAEKREYLYGEMSEDGHATRMIREGSHKLIYYAVGNCCQLFDLEKDPNELTDVSDSSEYADVRARLTDRLIGELYGGDEAWVKEGKLVGLPDRPFVRGPNRGLSSQRGEHWPPPPKTDTTQIEWFPEPVADSEE